MPNIGKIKYGSRRQIVYGSRGMVATSQHLAAMAGMDILKKGGNAIDAAIATAMALTVVEPCSNGIGSDAFAIIWKDGKLHGFNSSGYSPASINIDAVKALGHKEMPKMGPLAVTVPGAPAAWAELNRTMGRLPLSEVAAPAVEYARNGFAVSPLVGSAWQGAAKIYDKKRGEVPGIESWFHTFAKDGFVPSEGDVVRLPDHADTLEKIAATGGDAFYKGEIGEKVCDYLKSVGGFMKMSDFEAYKPSWVDPISVNYRGYDVCEIPPNGQGIIALMALNILRGFEFNGREDPRTYHLQLEAIKLAFADARQYVSDPRNMKVSVEQLLSEDFAAQRRKLITDKAQVYAHGIPRGSDTVYLCTADNEGNMVSYIQSNYAGFGSGIVVPGTGVSLQNRGSSFNLDPGHVNALAPSKRPYHTIIPGFIMKDGLPVGPFGLMGGFMQPQGHVQMIMNMFDFGLDVQESLDAPRWQWMEENSSILEPDVPIHVYEGLKAMGHDIKYVPTVGSFGRGQSIFRHKDALMGATEPRTDGGCIAY